MRAILTAVLDLAGLLTGTAAATVAVWHVDPAAGLATTAVGLLGSSWLIGKMAPAKDTDGQR